MYQVLLVDDEPMALETIRNMADWEKLGVEHVMTAQSVSYAKHILENFRIQLVICDVEMPEMNGIEFAEYIRENYPDTMVIMLSCHAEFQYAQDAMRAGSIDYILKPVREDVLEERIGNAFERLRQWQQITKSADKWKENEPVRKEWFLKACIDGQLDESAELAEHILRNELRIEEQSVFLPILITVRNAADSKRSIESSVLEYSICSAAQNTIVRKDDNGVSFRLADGEILSILENNTCSGDALQKYCCELIRECSDVNGCAIACYVGKDVSLTELRSEVRTLRLMAEENPTVNTVSAEVQTGEGAGSDTQNNWSAYYDRFDKSLNSMNLREFRSEVEAFLQLLEQQTVDNSDFRKLQFVLLKMMESFLEKNNLQADLLYNDPFCMQERQNALNSTEKFTEWFRYLMQRVEENLHKVHQQSTLISSAKDFIQVHLSEDVDRDSVAKAVFVSPDYLSRVFKKETGMGLNEYIVCCRIDMAKKLLAQTNLAVGTIAVQLGYSSFSHFTKVFREHVGTTPVAFRHASRR